MTFLFISLPRCTKSCVAGYAPLCTPPYQALGIFTRLCEEANAKGNLNPDAYYAALAIETGGE